MNPKITPALLRAFSQAVGFIVDKFAERPLGCAALVVVIRSIGAAVAVSHAQIVIA